ncbi:MAG: prolipoprotein diacylglyceryl transferase [Pseudobdellovibrionaceae bacterium]
MYPIIPITKSISIPTYYLILSATLCICLLWLTRRTRLYHLSQKAALDLSLIIMVNGFIGARLFHVFYEEFNYYLENPWRVLHFWNGGFVFYGGALLSGIAAMLYLYRFDKKHLESYLDLFTPVLSLSYILGRTACLFAGCCYGKHCDLPWAISGRHPTQAYASIWELGVLFILLGIEKTAPKERQIQCLKKSGSLFYLWLILHGIGRLIMEAYRDDFRGPSLGLSVSSWISLGIIGTASHFLFRRPKLAD